MRCGAAFTLTTSPWWELPDANAVPDLLSMRIVLTGAAGRLGQAVLRQLLEAGDRVDAYDAVPAPADAPGSVRVQNLLDPRTVDAAWRGADAVVHLANHATSYGLDGRMVLTENITMNYHVLERARLGGVPRFIFASSIQAMRVERFSPDHQPSSVRELPLSGASIATPTNPYALSKALGEEQLRYFVGCHGMTGIAFRFPALFPEPRPRGIVEVVAHVPLDEAFAWLTYADAARAVGQALRRPLKGYRCYLPASARPWLDWPIERIRERYFPNVPIAGGGPLRSLVDLRPLADELDWRPQDD